MTAPDPTVALERIAGRILRLRGENVMLDADLAALYGVETKALNRAVKRNAGRFPEDFMFQLTTEEAANLRYQSGTSSGSAKGDLRSQSVISKSRDARGVAVYHLDIEGESLQSEAAILRSQSVTSSAWGGRRHLPFAFTEQGVAMLASVLGSERAIQANIAIIRALMREPEHPSRPMGFRPDEEEAP